MTNVYGVTTAVKTVQEAQRVIADLLERFAGPVAKDELTYRGQEQHRSFRAMTYRTAGNVLRLGTTRRNY